MHRYSLLKIACLTLLLWHPNFAFSQQIKKIVLIGDSLTEGYGVAKESTYGSILQQKIKAAGKSWQVEVSGISGSTSASAPARIKWILQSKPDLIVLAIGANDALRGLKVTETTKNIESAILLAKSKNVRIILAGLLAPPNYGTQYTKDFASIYKSLAKKHQLKLIPFLLEGVAGHAHYNLADGIHPNEKGHQMIAETVFSAIKDVL